MTPAAKDAVPNILAAFKEAPKNERALVAQALLNLMKPEKNLSRAALWQQISELEGLRKTFFKDFNERETDRLDDILRLVQAEYEKQPPFWRELVEKYKLQEKWWFWALAGYLVLVFLCLPTWLLLLLHPLWLYRFNELLSPVSVKFPYLDRPAGLNQLLLLSRFHYHNRVLDAWVHARLSQALAGFAALKTVQSGARVCRRHPERPHPGPARSSGFPGGLPKNSLLSAHLG
jgi:hypothetical protein